jgi:hypothetical protein
VSNQVEIIYSSSRNSKETGEIIRISPRKSARGIRPLQKLSGIHKLYKASKVHKCLATADVEVRNFRKIRFSPVKLKVILRIVNAVLNGLRTTQFYRPFNYPPDKKFIRWIAAKHRLS